MTPPKDLAASELVRVIAENIAQAMLASRAIMPAPDDEENDHARQCANELDRRIDAGEPAGLS